jgi:phosphotransferase system HPr (HPr) family protein
LSGRIQSYGIGVVRAGAVHDGVLDSVERVRGFAGRAIRTLLEAVLQEAGHLGLEITPQAFPEENFLPVVARQRLPRNVGEEVIGAEEQKIAEVASKFLQACDMFRQMNIRRLEDAEGRRRLLSQVCTEEQARVYEATVHNLQSAYDTYIKNTVLESENEQRPPLRGFASVALHLLQAVTGLAHFYERHENDIRSQAAKTRIAELVDRTEVQDVILNHLLYWAKHFMESARSVAEGLVRRYTNLQELEVELDDDLALHARPAALIVGIANHYGTPVELEVAGRRCNAGSILDLLVTIGSHPDERRFVFRGDVNPLHDIGLLFQYGLGENGIDRLPDKLSYLRNVQ